MVAVGILLVDKFVGTDKGKTYVMPSPLVVVGNAQKGSISQKIVLSSHIEAKTMIPVIPLVSGTVMDYPIVVGQSVKEGDIIAQLDSEPFKQQMLQAQAAYLAYESTYQRVKALYESKNTTVQNYEQVKAQRDSAKAQLDLSNLQMDYATLRAKSSGTIITAPSSKGSTAAQGTPLAVIADLTDLVVNLKVPEKDYDMFIKNKDDILVTVQRPKGNVKVQAEVCTIDPYIQPQSKTFNVQCQLLGDVSSFRPGMYVKTTVEYDRRDGVYVLPQSVRKADGSLYVYNTKTRNVSHVEFTPLVEDEQSFIVPEGLEQALFVIDGQNSVFDGQIVRVTP